MKTKCHECGGTGRCSFITQDICAECSGTGEVDAVPEAGKPIPATTKRIIAMLTDRAETGLAKYGVTIDRDDLTFEEWATHAQEEMLDGAQYLERAKVKWREREEEIARLQRRIAAMESVGDEMAEWMASDRNLGNDAYMARRWIKAKGTK